MAIDKLVDSSQLDSDLTSVANAIREKGGTSDYLDFPSGFVTAINKIQSYSDPDNGDVVFVDYNGAIVATKTKAEINAMTSDSNLPENPAHNGLIAQGWNWTVLQLQAQLAAMPNQKIYVGQTYTTASGATEIDVVMQKGALSPVLSISIDGTISVDWGDNTTPDTQTGTSLSTTVGINHTYSRSGNYTIKISGLNNSTYRLYGSASIMFFHRNNGGTTQQSRAYAVSVRKVRIGQNAEIGSYAFNYCSCLSSITIPNNISLLGTAAFYYCEGLDNVIIPKTITGVQTNLFRCCYSISRIVLPGTLTSVSNLVFASCLSLPELIIPNSVTSFGTETFGSSASFSCITLPNGITSIPNSMFSGCNGLSSIIIPNNITSIGDNAFKNCLSMTEYHVLCTTPPTLGATVFSGIVSGCVIYVPRGKLSVYQATSGWADYASYMQEEPV